MPGEGGGYGVCGGRPRPPFTVFMDSTGSGGVSGVSQGYVQGGL